MADQKKADFNRRGQLSVQLVRSGKFEESKTELTHMLQIYPFHAATWYNLACTNAALDDKEETFRCLEKAIKLGYNRHEKIQNDPLLRKFKNTPQFASCVLAAKNARPTGGANALRSEILALYDNLLTEDKMIELIEGVPDLRLGSTGAQTHNEPLQGPLDKSPPKHFETGHGSSYLGARCVSLYPRKKDGVRESDPIADYYYAQSLDKGAILSLADGCGWGHSSAEAAERASKAFVASLGERRRSCVTTRDAARAVMSALMDANEALYAGMSHRLESGMTALVGGLVLPLEGTPNQHAFVCISVGDTKAFVWRAYKRKILDVTSGNRTNLTSARDPGGRLGPYVNDHDPDLRNLGVYYKLVEPDDVIILCSDGVHDNFDPQALGILPQELPEMQSSSPTTSSSPNNLRRMSERSSHDKDSNDHNKLKRVSSTSATRVRSMSPPPPSQRQRNRKRGNGPLTPWEIATDADEQGVRYAKEAFMATRLSQVIRYYADDNGRCYAPTLAHELVEYCLDITSTVRTKMETEGVNQPETSRQMPGKLDHCSCLCYCVAKAAAAEELDALSSRHNHFDGDFDLRTLPYYHGRIRGQEANARLAARPAGSFLLRQSTRSDGYVVSVVASQVKHVMLNRTGNGWVSVGNGGRVWQTLNDVIASFGKSLKLPVARPDLEKELPLGQTLASTLPLPPVRSSVARINAPEFQGLQPAPSYDRPKSEKKSNIRTVSHDFPKSTLHDPTKTKAVATPVQPSLVSRTPPRPHRTTSHNDNAPAPPALDHSPPPEFADYGHVPSGTALAQAALHFDSLPSTPMTHTSTPTRPADDVRRERAELERRLLEIKSQIGAGHYTPAVHQQLLQTEERLGELVDEELQADLFVGSPRVAPDLAALDHEPM